MRLRYLVAFLTILSLISLVSAAAHFSASPTHLLPGDTVFFTDESTESPDWWQWDIWQAGGSEFIFYEQNPNYTFADPGIYNVRLMTRTGGGPITSWTEYNYITIYPTEYIFDTPGTYTWTAPTGVDITSVSVDISGGGGSGRGCYIPAVYHYSGNGGTAADNQQYSSIPVAEGSTYTVVVGAGGIADAPTNNNYDSGNAGGPSSVFGYTMAGGAGALGNRGVANGGDAIGVGFLTTDLIAEDGDDGTDGYLGGNASVGYGGGGGGAASDTTGAAYGGAGAGGIVRIYLKGHSSSGNVPDFTASPRSGAAGALVTFTDLSVIGDLSDVTYNWSFGDGEYSSTVGDVLHVYPYIGSYNVALTITSTNGTVTELKEAYLNFVSVQQELDLKTEPKSVQFHVQSIWGAPLTGANVSIIGISTSTGNWDWLTSLLGIPLDEVALNNTAMSQTTDSMGNVEFLMIPTAKYNVTTTLAGYDFSVFYVTPHDERYTIISSINGSGWFQTGNNSLVDLNVTVESVKLNDTAGQINITYFAQEGVITGGTVYIYAPNETKGGADVLVDTIPVTGSSGTVTSTQTFTDQYGGQDYKVSFVPAVVGGQELTGGNDRSFAVWFKGKTVGFAGFDPIVLLWLSLFIIIFTAMFSGATHAPQIAIVICVESWIFYAMGWLDPLTGISVFGSTGGDPGIILALSMATFMAVLWNFREGKRKEKGT